MSTISGLVDRLEAQCARLTAEADTISSRLDGDVSVERKRLTDEGELAVSVERQEASRTVELATELAAAIDGVNAVVASNGTLQRCVEEARASAAVARAASRDY